MKIVWMAAGCIALGLGVLGALLPLLPTVPFLLLATFCFARSSPRLHDWLVTHQTLGPPIRAWRENGAISRKAKILATLTIGATFSVSVILQLGWVILFIQAAALLAVLAFIWSRPDGEET